jgi:hypothetical protein
LEGQNVDKYRMLREVRRRLTGQENKTIRLLVSGGVSIDCEFQEIDQLNGCISVILPKDNAAKSHIMLVSLYDIIAVDLLDRCEVGI